MRKTLLAFMLLATTALATPPAFAQKAPRVLLTTNMGEITLELDAERAPISVANFLQYVKDGFYNDTIFHRVISKFMVQGGGFTADYKRKETRAAIKNEAKNGLKNERGTVAMARTRDVDSATAQFFINVVDNDFLNNSSRGYGYAVFGKVSAGMEIVDKIRGVRTGSGGPFRSDVPRSPIIIEKVQVLEDKADGEKAEGEKK